MERHEDLLAAASKIADGLIAAGVTTPAIVSTTADGAVRLEWHGLDWITSIDCEPDGTIEVIFNRTVQRPYTLTYASIDLALDGLGDFASFIPEPPPLL